MGEGGGALEDHSLGGEASPVPINPLAPRGGGGAGEAPGTMERFMALHMIHVRRAPLDPMRDPTIPIPAGRGGGPWDGERPPEGRRGGGWRTHTQAAGHQSHHRPLEAHR